MKIKIKRIDTDLPLPDYHTSGAAAFDFYARVDTVVPPHTQVKIPTGLIIATPAGYVLTMSPRSSLAHKKGLLFPNGFGIIDSDYAGEGDEIMLSVYNFTDTPTSVTRGERLAQGLFIKVERAEWDEVEKMSEPNRGGFGSTG